MSIIFRQHSYKSSASVESLGSKTGKSSPLCSTPVRERISPFGDRTVGFINRSASTETMKGTISPPPPNEEIPASMVSKHCNFFHICFMSFFILICFLLSD